MGMFYRTIRMMDNGIKPVYVFDGKPPEMKSGEVIIGLSWYKQAYRTKFITIKDNSETKVLICRFEIEI